MSQTQQGIIDNPLPEYLNFNALKSLAIADLKQLAGSVWSNFNESDPGVTILDQLVYGLTELGYCADFPIVDLLTQANGSINSAEQFYLPADILTSGPITADDYRRYLLDNFPDLIDCYLEPELLTRSTQADSLNGPSGAFFTYVYWRETLTGAQITQLNLNLHNFLNAQRGVCEYFYPPQSFVLRRFYLQGKATLAANANIDTVAPQAVQALKQLGMPDNPRWGYAQLQAQGWPLDAIFNGPKMQAGWFTPGPLKQKIATVDINDIAACLSQVPGILALDNLLLTDAQAASVSTPCAIAANEIALITLAVKPKWVFEQNLEVVSMQQPSAAYLRQLQHKHANLSLQSRLDLIPPVPTGRYRDVESYYSVQNTFPNNYHLGQNSLGADASDYRIAQARQLKAYLLLFDQVLANEFSQLARAAELFSFSKERTAGVGQVANALGIPYAPFCATYFAQPLYTVPDVAPLLKGTQAFDYEFSPHTTPEQIQQQAWQAYQQNPFNPYWQTLQKAIEQEPEALDRRDRFLTHMWARQGENASLYDDMLKTCQWYDGVLNTRIIVKTLWLQNLPLLSYHRAVAASFQLTSPLFNPGRFQFTQSNYRSLLTCGVGDGLLASLHACVGTAGASRQQVAKKIINYLTAHNCTAVDIQAVMKALRISDNNQLLAQANIARAYPPRINGAINSQAIFQANELGVGDLQLFSGFELKLGILLGLSHYLRTLAGNLACLILDKHFTHWVGSAHEGAEYTLQDPALRVLRLAKKDEVYFEQNKIVEIRRSPRPTTDNTGNNSAQVSLEDYQAHLDQLHWLAQHSKGFLLFEHSLLLQGLPKAQVVNTLNRLAASLVFPSYVCLFSTKKFAGFIDTLANLHWPLHIRLTKVPASFVLLKKLIAARVAWINSKPLTAEAFKDSATTNVQAQAAEALCKLLALMNG